MELESLRSKLTEEEIAHKKVQEQFLVEKLKRVSTPNATEEEIKNDSQEIIKGSLLFSLLTLSSRFLLDLERKLDVERLSLKKSNEEFVQMQKKARILEMDLKQITANYNQLSQDHQLFKQSNEQIIEQMESDQQRRNQYDKDLKYLQQQLTHALNGEKQAMNELNQIKIDNQRLQDELRTMIHDYENIKLKLIDYEEQVEGKTSKTELFVDFLVLFLFFSRK